MTTNPGRVRAENERLREKIFALIKERDLLLIEKGQLKQALAHYRNNPPPHPAGPIEKG